jgi:hypothetical protein
LSITACNNKHPSNIDMSLNEATADKIIKYGADYNNNPPSTVSFMPAIASTSGRLHSEFVRLLFFQDHRETDRFFFSFRSSASATWSWPVPPPPRGFCFSAQKQGWPGSRQGCSFTYQLKYWWVSYNFTNTYSPITLANISSIKLVSIFRCCFSPSNPVYARRLDSSALVFSLSSHRHSYIGLVFSSHFIDS